MVNIPFTFEGVSVDLTGYFYKKKWKVTIDSWDSRLVKRMLWQSLDSSAPSPDHHYADPVSKWCLQCTITVIVPEILWIYSMSW